MGSRKEKYVEDDEFYTPKEVLEYFGGGFNYDPSTTEARAKELGIEHCDTIDTDGLSKDWTQYKKIWVNPPFTLKFEFLKKAIETHKLNNEIEIYFLTTTESLCTKKFAEITKDISYKIYMPSGRINFQSGLGKVTKSPAFSTVVIKFECIRSIEVVDVSLLKPKKEK